MLASAMYSWTANVLHCTAYAHLPTCGARWQTRFGLRRQRIT